MDKDLTTKENYYTPGDLVQDEVNGLWYTTHRASWNTMFDTNEITAYIVTGIDDKGKMTLVEVTGGIIPKGVPVLLECQSNDVTRNVMIPTLTAATFTATSGNILKSPDHYYPNESAPEAAPAGQSYYALGKAANGNIGFVTQVTNTSTGMNGNRGYYLGPSPAIVNPEYLPVTLAELLASGDMSKTYEITDLTAVEVLDNDRLIICKDDNGAAAQTAGDDEIDYINDVSGLANGADHSNWVGLRLPEGQQATASNVQMNKTLGNVIGRLVNTANPEVQLEALPEVGQASSYTANVYIPASMKGTQTSPFNGKTYFFAQPKPMELASFEWAQWDGEKFVTPEQNVEYGVNTAGLTGDFVFNGAYLLEGGVDEMTAGDIYSMTALVKAKPEGYDQFGHVYVLGNVNGLNPGNWSPAKGVEMYTGDGNVYTTTLTVDNVDDGAGYLSFSGMLGEDWDDIKASRFGGDTQNPTDNFWVTNNNLGVPLTLKWWANESRSFHIPAGRYTLTVNLSDKTLVVRLATGASQAPLRAGDGSTDFVVYPLQMSKTGHVSEGIITGVTQLATPARVVSVTYHDLTGRVSTRPFSGLNIEVTRYTDGTSATRKVIR